MLPIFWRGCMPSTALNGYSQRDSEHSVRRTVFGSTTASWSRAGNSIKTLLSKRTFRGSRNQVGVAPISLEASGEHCCFGSDHCNDVAAMKSNVKEWNPSWLLSHTSGIPQGTSGILWLFVLLAPEEKHLKRGVEMVQQFPTPDFGTRRQGLLTPKAVVVVDTTPHKAVTCGELELSCAIVEDATKKWRYMALPFEPLSAREPAGPASRSLRALWSRAQGGSPTRDRRQQGRHVDGRWQNGRASREKVVRCREQVICHCFFIWFVTLWVLHLMLTEGGVGTNADVGEGDSRDVERRCLKHKENTNGCHHTISYLGLWCVEEGWTLDKTFLVQSAVMVFRVVRIVRLVRLSRLATGRMRLKMPSSTFRTRHKGSQGWNWIGQTRGKWFWTCVCKSLEFKWC